MCSSESMAAEKSDGTENLGRVGAKTNFDKRGALRVREAVAARDGDRFVQVL